MGRFVTPCARSTRPKPRLTAGHKRRTPTAKQWLRSSLTRNARREDGHSRQIVSCDGTPRRRRPTTKLGNSVVVDRNPIRNSRRPSLDGRARRHRDKRSTYRTSSVVCECRGLVTHASSSPDSRPRWLMWRRRYESLGTADSLRAAESCARSSHRGTSGSWAPPARQSLDRLNCDGTPRRRRPSATRSLQIAVRSARPSSLKR
jgi:hypothetical protein